MFEQPTAAIDSRHRGFFGESGDHRQVWALDTELGNVIYLPEGGIDERVRERCAAGLLRCPLHDCPDPRFIARGGARKRHHFAHRVAHTKHKAGVVWRAEAVAMLSEWASRYPSARVSSSGDGLVGEVAVESGRTGRAVRLEVIYDRRREVPWDEPEPGRQYVLGHARSLLLPREEFKPGIWWCGEGRLMGDVLLAHQVVIAVNPERRLVATLFDEYKARARRLLPARGWSKWPHVCFVEELDDCQLDETGIVTPALARYRAAEPKAASVPTPAHTTAEAPGRPGSAWVGRRDVAVKRDPLQEEYLRRKKGLSPEEQQALLREMFLPKEYEQDNG